MATEPTAHERMIAHLTTGVGALDVSRTSLQRLVGEYLEHPDELSVTSDGERDDEA